MNRKFLFSLVAFCALAGNVLATCVDGVQMRINSVTLSTSPESEQTMVVPPNSRIIVNVDGGLKSGGTWISTQITVDGETYCFNNDGDNSKVNGSTWVNRLKTFQIPGPDLVGIYELEVKMFEKEHCVGCDIDDTTIMGVGLMGPQGPQGEPGEDGVDGQDGQDGADGEDGIDGQDGQDGADGQDGTDGQDGEDGADGIGCSIVNNEDGTSTLTCGSESQTVTVSDGINCYDLNANGTEDLCDPLGLAEFGSCEEFSAWCLQPEVIEDVSASKLGTELKVYSAYSFNEAGFKCGWTEDTNGDGTVDVLDCRGQDGNDGEDGEDGSSGHNGADGSSCSVVDNKNGTYTMTCEDGTTVTWADGTDGLNGQDGIDGSDGSGVVGRPGDSCSLVENPDGTATINCGNAEFVVGQPDLVITEVPPDGRMCGNMDALSLLLSAGALAAAAGFMPNRNRRKF